MIVPKIRETTDVCSWAVLFRKMNATIAAANRIRDNTVVPAA